MLESDFELIVVNAPLPDEFGHDLCATAVEKTDAGVVFLVKAAAAEQLLQPMSEQGVLLVCKPFSNTLFLQAIHMAAASNHRLLVLRQENARMQEKLAAGAAGEPGQVLPHCRKRDEREPRRTATLKRRPWTPGATGPTWHRRSLILLTLRVYNSELEVWRARALLCAPSLWESIFLKKQEFIRGGQNMATKFIFVTGGVVSGLGKGITAASLGRLLKCRGLKVASQKLDPYVNVDPGTMSPLQHGEVFVTDDGTETDLDLGHYERFIDENLNKYSNLTTGKVYWNVLNKERQGAYLGQTVQIIPHITNEIKSYIYNLASSTEADVVITEIGGTTGDIESQPFLEAIRQVGLEQGRDNCCYIHVVLVPYISGSDEYKIQARPALGEGAAGHGHQPGHHHPARRRQRGRRHPPEDQHLLQRQARVRHREPDHAQPLPVPADAAHRRSGRRGGARS